MKQKLKRFMAGFMAMLTLVGTLFTNGTTAFAASPQANIAFWNASVKNSGEVSELKPGYNHGKILYAILDGNSAYCMNFGLRADGGQLMNSYDDASTSMSAQQRKINHQNERYDALNKKLSEIETSKDDEEVRGRLVKENQDKDALINSQQNELNKASSTIARLRDDIEKKDKEMKRMGDRIESLEDKIISVATENKKEAESKAELQESQSVSQADKKMVDTVAVPQNMQAVANGIPVYYQIPIVDGTGNVVQRLPIERSVRKSSNSGVASLFARLSFKKKSRADIVKLVASGDLVPAQLVQIKSAIEKGLTESQLVELINNNISAEKMKEIIEIAVLENSMAD